MIAVVGLELQIISVDLQSSYRKAVAASRRDKKVTKQQGLTEVQKEEIRSGER